MKGIIDMKPNALIVGGTSGLGLILAKKLSEKYNVIITGRNSVSVPNLTFVSAEFTNLPHGLDEIRKLIYSGMKFSLVVYAAGFYQEGKIDEISHDQITKMANVGLIAPALLMSLILKEQKELDGFIAITSTSSWTPRLKEPVYTGVKAGLGMLANSLSLDDRIKKTLVAGPAGMKTEFWEGTTKDTSKMLDPEWVADKILDAFRVHFKYSFIKLLRYHSDAGGDTLDQVEIVELR